MKNQKPKKKKPYYKKVKREDYEEESISELRED